MYEVIGIDFIGLNLGFNISFLRQIICFVYLSFTLGFALLRIFKLHEMGRAETILFSAALSIALLMFIGLLMNLLYPIARTTGS